MTWTLHNTDCIEHMATMEAESMDLAVFSPPFPAMYVYNKLEHAEAERMGAEE